MKLTEDIETAFENRNECGTVFVDLSAAYDTVWHIGLVLKMLQLIPNTHKVRFISEHKLQTEYSSVRWQRQFKDLHHQERRASRFCPCDNAPQYICV